MTFFCVLFGIARLVPVESDQLFTALIDVLIDQLKNCQDDGALQTYIQCIVAIKYDNMHI